MGNLRWQGVLPFIYSRLLAKRVFWNVLASRAMRRLPDFHEPVKT